MRKLVNWFRRDKLETSFDRELQYHLERRVSDLERTGLAASEARRHAVLELGGLVQVREEVRDVWLTRWGRDLIYDLRFSLRSFYKTPSFTTTAVLSLMLGIGATTVLYSLVDQILLHALPAREPERLVLIDWKGDYVTTDGFGSWNLMSYPICRDLDRQKQFFEGVFCRALREISITTEGFAEPATAEVVSGNYFQVLGVGPSIGRVLTTEDDGVPNANPVVVLSYSFWKTKLGGASDVIGRKLLVNNHPMTVIGVAAQTFQGIDVGQVPVIWIAASMSEQVIPGFKDYLSRRTRWMQILGRLQPGMTLRQAESGLEPWFKTMLRDDMRLPDFPVITAERRHNFLNSSLVLTAAPQGHSELRRRLVEPLWVLFAVTGVLLGLACLNVSSLFLARGSAHEREIGTRLALGASRGRLGRQLLTDSLVIALAGGLLGTAAAPLAVRALIAFLPQGNAPNALHAGVDWRLLLFALGTSLAAGLLSGLAPGWQARRQSFSSCLRERGGTGSGGAHIRKAIVTVQIALTFTLVIGAALFTRTLETLMAKGPGFDTTSLVSFEIRPAQNGYSASDGNRLIRRLDELIRQSPITQASAVARFALLTGGSWNDPITILAGKRIATREEVNLNAVTPGFFATMGIKIVAGRNFDDRDVRSAGDPGYRSAIVNEALVKRYFGARNPIGALISMGNGPDAKPNIQIVGIMSNFSYRGLREESEQAYFPFLEGSDVGPTFYVRVRGAPETALHNLRAIVQSVDPTLPMIDFRTVNEQVNRSLNTEHILATLSSSFSALALLMSLVGLYGVMSFVVTRRTREIGIRLALGAQPRSAVWLILRDALVMIVSGIAIGLPLVWALGRLVESQLYDVKPSDPVVIAAAVLILGFAAMAAAWIPAWRASGVDPTEALRAE
ncbi:MAG: ABC transporter permease [Acidobacteriaceae bacterium]|nr:ABC transporter permease [Acidobacteriaceae bacterium]